MKKNQLIVLIFLLYTNSAFSAGNMLATFLIGKVFDVAFNSLFFNGGHEIISNEEVVLMKNKINEQLPVSISDDLIFSKANATAPQTLSLDFVWLSNKVDEIDMEVFDLAVGMPLKYYACTNFGYRNWYERSGNIIFKFQDKNGVIIREYWSNLSSCVSE